MIVILFYTTIDSQRELLVEVAKSVSKFLSTCSGYHCYEQDNFRFQF